MGHKREMIRDFQNKLKSDTGLLPFEKELVFKTRVGITKDIMNVERASSRLSPIPHLGNCSCLCSE